MEREMFEIFDTVAAISTPRGKGGIAVIRISGAEAAAVLGRVFAAASSPAEHPRRAVLGKILDAEGQVIDEGIAVFFKGPHPFTGEDVAELSCHGGVLVTECVLSAVLAAGARLATAGEFTRRALINGKMTLSSAEALGALLEAKTTGQMTLAGSGMQGRLSAAVGESFTRLSALLADAYAKIDFPDEDLNTMSREELTEALSHVLDLERLITRIVYGSANGKDLRAVSNTAEVLPEVRELLSTCKSDRLRRICEELDPLLDVHARINEAIREDAPFSVREGGIIADGFNRDVDYLRSVMTDGKSWLEKLAE